MDCGRMRGLVGQLDRLHEPAGDDAELVEPDVASSETASTGTAIFVEQRSEATARFERISLPTCDDREVVRRIAGPSELPVDHVWRFAGHEEDVLAE